MTSAKVLPEFSQISPTAIRSRPMMEGSAEGDNSPTREETLTYQIYTQPASSFHNLQTLVEVASASAAGRLGDGEGLNLTGGVGSDPCDPVHMVWEQDSVRHLQDALNSQDSISTPQSPQILTDIHQLNPVNGGIRNLGGLDLIRKISNGAPIRTVGDGSTVIRTISGATDLPFEDDLSSTSAVTSSKPAAPLQRAKNKSVDGAPPKQRRRRGEDGADDGPRPCGVCGEEAGKHSYYGGQVCASCRAFFRRSVTSGANKTYFCVKNGNCEVNSKTRKQCQFCRYRLCEEAGMKTSWVLTEKPVPAESTSNKRKHKDIDNPSPDPPSGRSVHITETELTLINELVEISDILEPSKVNDMDTTLIREIIRMVAFKARLSESGLRQLATTLKTRSRKVALRLREMQQLSQEDRDEILTKNIPILIKLKISTFFNPHLSWRHQLKGLLGTDEVEKLDRKLKSLQVKDLESYRLKYSQFFLSPFLETDDSEQEFCKLLNKIGSWPEDPEEYILISILLLFCPDLLNLNDRARVEQIQSSLAELLHNYLNYKHGREKGRSKFASAMFLVSRCRQLHDLLTHHNIDFSL